MKLLLDTNVLLDYFAQREPFFRSWDKLNAMQVMGDAELWVSAESFTDIFYVLRGVVDPHDLQAAFIESLSFMRVCAVGSSEIMEAAQRSWNDFEDCLIDVCAQRIKADYLITRDNSGFEESCVPWYTPMDFFSMLEHDYGLVYDEIDW